MSNFPSHASPSEIPEELKQIWSTKQQLAQVQTDLEEVLSQRSNTPRLTRSEIQAKDHEIEQLRNIVGDLEYKLMQQEAILRSAEDRIQNQKIQLNQQAETIKVHSNELSKFHERPSKFDPSPCRLPSQFNSQGIQDGPPPNFNLGNGERRPDSRAMSYAPPNQQPLAFNTKWGPIRHDTQPPNGNFYGRPDDMFSNGSEHRGVTNGRDSPMPSSQMANLSFTEHINGRSSATSTPPRKLAPIGTRPQHVSTPGTSTDSGGNLVAPRAVYTPVRSASALSKPRSLVAAMVSYAPGSRERELTVEWQNFLDDVVLYCHTHINFPSNSGDAAIDPALKQRILGVATKTTAFKLISDQKTRYLLISKLVLSWMSATIFTDTLFASGLSEDIDNAIRTIKAKMNDNPPAIVRAVYKQDLRRQFTELKNQQTYPEYMNHKCSQRSTELWTMVKPLMYQKNPSDWDDTCKIVRQAHRLAEMLFSDTAEYRMFFPKTNDRFNDASMINMDGEFSNMTPDNIMAQGGLVRLGAVPQVMARTTEKNGTSNTNTLLKAGVLLRFPENNR